MLTHAQRRPRGPSIVHSVLVSAMVLLIALVAITQQTPSPPAIAEFAPQAVDRITDSPDDRSGASGKQGDVDGTGVGVGAAAAGAAAIEQPRVRRCVGDPPRQIEDPQSPPCVPYWTGDNGGRTSRGVTADQITVAASPGGNTSGTRVLKDLESFFNNRFELYGRSLRLVAPPASKGSDCPGRRADVEAIVEEVGAFAVVAPTTNAQVCFSDESARRGLVQIATTQWVPERDMTAGRPFLWQYPMSYDELLASWARWTCMRLAGEKAAYAPDPTIAMRQRRFGLIAQFQYTPSDIDVGPMRAELARCGEELASTQIYVGGSGNPAQNALNAVIDMKAKGVTTVLCFCATFTSEFVSSSATGQGYFPEWSVSDQLGRNWSVKVFWPNSEQRRGLLGFFTFPEQVPYSDTALNWALAEADPGFQITQNIELEGHNTIYWQLLLLASGIQMAGPALTPHHMERALQRTQFPNPATPPVQEGRAGFALGRHSMIHDAAVAWWDEAAEGPYHDDGAGAWCYAESGRRFAASEWTKSKPHVFEGPCLTSPV